MAKILAEKDFTSIFNSTTYGNYFKVAIDSRNWGYLLYSNDFYIPYLVHEFYNSVTTSNIDHENHIIHVN